jgi:glyoxylate reductase
MATLFLSGALPPSPAVDGALARLAEMHEVVRNPAGLASAAFGACAARVSAIVTLLTDRVDGALLARTPALAIVANVAVGVDNVDLAACAARGIIVTNTPDVLTEATADVAFGLLLAAARRLAEGDRLVRAGGWTGWTPTFMLGRKVHGATLGIVGLGRIGKAVARRARGFGMPVLYTQRTRLPEPLERALGATWTPDVDELCAWSDIVSLHCPLTAQTRHLMDAARLARMRPGSVLVNTSRGALVDEDALARALAVGPLGAAGLDVYEDEPRVRASLAALPNVVLSPHLGSADIETREAMASLAIENARRVMAGEPPITPVTLAAPVTLA